MPSISTYEWMLIMSHGACVITGAIAMGAWNYINMLKDEKENNSSI